MYVDELRQTQNNCCLRFLYNNLVEIIPRQITSESKRMQCKRMISTGDDVVRIVQKPKYDDNVAHNEAYAGENDISTADNFQFHAKSKPDNVNLPNDKVIFQGKLTFDLKSTIVPYNFHKVSEIINIDDLVKQKEARTAC